MLLSLKQKISYFQIVYNFLYFSCTPVTRDDIIEHIFFDFF